MAETAPAGPNATPHTLLGNEDDDVDRVRHKVGGDHEHRSLMRDHRPIGMRRRVAFAEAARGDESRCSEPSELRRRPEPGWLLSGCWLVGRGRRSR
jgi:hypothetical protein